jgi:hypothetical protein
MDILLWSQTVCIKTQNIKAQNDSKNGYIEGQLDKTRKEVSKLVGTTALGVSLLCFLYLLPALIVMN